MSGWVATVDANVINVVISIVSHVLILRNQRLLNLFWYVSNERVRVGARLSWGLSMPALRRRCRGALEYCCASMLNRVGQFVLNDVDVSWRKLERRLMTLIEVAAKLLIVYNTEFHAKHGIIVGTFVANKTATVMK